MKYVVLGASAAGMNAVRELRKLDGNGEIVLISKDKEVYSRCILHHYLGDTRTIPELMFVEHDFESRYRVSWIKGLACTGLDCAVKTVTLEDGSSVDYDKLLIATGAHTFLPPIEGLAEAKNTFGFRNIEDVEQIKAAAKTAKHPVVLGAGLVGIDTVTGLLHLGKAAAVIEVAEWLLPKQLDQTAAAAYQKVYEEQGVTFLFGTKVNKLQLDQNGAVEALSLSTGETVPCDLLVVTAGVRSNIDFLEGTGVATDKFGLIIDEKGRTSQPDIFGAGDVTGRSPIWPAAVKEGMIAAANMTGESRTMTDYFASKSTMNFMGIPTMSLGLNVAPDDSYQEEILQDEDNYKKIIHKGGKIYGAILQGDLSYAGILTQLIAHRIDVSKVEKPLFQIDYSDFFNVNEEFEFYYDETEDNGNE